MNEKVLSPMQGEGEGNETRQKREGAVANAAW